MIRLAPGATLAFHEDTPMKPSYGELRAWMNNIRSGVLSASFGIENEMVLLALADEFGTNDRASIGSEYFLREQGWRENHSLERKIDRIKPIVRRLRPSEIADEAIQKLAEYRHLRNLLAHYPCWLEPVNREGATKLEDERTIALKLFIADRHHLWEIDTSQAVEWDSLMRFVRIAVENIRRELIGAPLLNADGSLPAPDARQPNQNGNALESTIEHGNVSQVVFPKST